MEKVFEVIDNDVIIGSYNSLFDAYHSIDAESSFIDIRSYIVLSLKEVEKSDEFTKFYDAVNNIYFALKRQYDDSLLNDWFVIRRDEVEPIYVRNTDKYISQVNHVLRTLGYTAYIRKSEESVKNNIKHYCKEHINIFLDIVNILIEHQLYNNHEWQKMKIYNPELDYDDNYSLDDSYNCIKDGKVYSATQAQVILDFLQDLDIIADVIYNNINEVYNYGIPSQLSEILK